MTDESGAPVSGALVTFELSRENNQESWSGVTGADGSVTVPARLLVEPGEYWLSAIYEGQPDVYEGTADVESFIVEKEDTTLQLSVAGKRETLVALLTDADDPSAPVAGAPIAFFANGADPLGTAITDGTGRAFLDVPNRYRGKKNTFEAIFDGSTDTYWNGSSSAD